MNFARSLLTVSGLTVASRIAGFARDALTATLLGAGPLADAFFVAQRLPNLFRSLFAEGAFSAAFVPLYTAEERKGGESAARRFAGEALALLLAILIPFSALVMAFMPQVITALAPGFADEPERFESAVHFGRIAFPYLILISITALQGGVLNASGRFAPAAAAPIAYNLVIICALAATQLLDLQVAESLAWAVVGAGVVQALWLAWHCRRAALAIPLLLPQFNASGRKLLKQVGPGALGAGAAQINILLSTVLASMLPAGAISYLFYADRLNQLPLGIIGIAVATTLLPLLSRHEESGNSGAVRHYTGRAVEFSLALGLPAAIGLMLASYPIIHVLFEHGEFSSADARGTAMALSAYSLGIPAFLLVKVFSAGCFARHDTATPVKMAVAGMLANIALSLLLLKPLGHVGIALANAAATWVNALLLLWHLKHREHVIGDDDTKKRVPRILLCSLGMAAITATATALITARGWFAERDILLGICGLSLIIVPSGAAYAVLLQLSGAMRWRDVLASFARK